MIFNWPVWLIFTKFIYYSPICDTPTHYIFSTNMLRMRWTSETPTTEKAAVLWELTRSNTRVAWGVLLVLGGMSLTVGFECWDSDGMFLIKVNLHTTQTHIFRTGGVDYHGWVTRHSDEHIPSKSFEKIYSGHTVLAVWPVSRVDRSGAYNLPQNLALIH